MLVKLKTEENSYQEKTWTHWKFYSIILQLLTNCFVCGGIISYKNKHIIVHLTEVCVSYILKFNVLHVALLLTVGIVAETILMSTGHGDLFKKEIKTCLWNLAPMYAGHWLATLKDASTI